MESTENRYKYIFDEILTLTDDGFVVVDTNGVITDINDQYCKYLKTTKEYAIGRSIAEIIPNTKMIDIVNYGYREEGAILRLSEERDDENDSIFLVNRSCVYDDDHKVIAGVAQVKFRLQTLDSAKKLMREYAAYEFYREEYQNRSNSQCSFDKIVGNSSRFAEVKKAGYKAAKTFFPVLLTGETGTGKEVFAHAIHNSSERREKPMVSINCAAIPNELLESELFGYEEGAFTGAKKGGKKGKFELADGGTLFLDEIGDMPLGMQAKLLRVLQEKEVEKIGGYQPIPVDVRIIAATRKNLPEMIAAEEFREDLYYRLNVLDIELPPLRERREDIVELASYFLNRLNSDYKTAISLSPEVRECFVSYDWPGNIRELDNVIKSAYAACEDFLIQLTDLPSKMVSRHHLAGEGGSSKKLNQMMEEYEKGILLDVLKVCGWNCQAAANELGIHRSALYKKIAKYDLQKK
ncbi:MAG: sigma-54 interaction domain-containing protein [Anaerotignum lactatifermentans]|uniref:sigma-54 interaction domain-containing protein n=1 Tax=Anaerotignum lactatifermentans TaxID=160404 RepID=UPI0026222DF9|nr:sigma 54-interacting transcriptional regulator [Anaerotignum lactatifermentans]